MRKIFVIILMMVGITVYAQEYTKIMGISLKESPASFEKKIIEKGFKKYSVDHNIMYDGVLEGPNDKCTIQINCESDTISDVTVIRYSKKNDKRSALNLYLSRYKKLTEKYGKYCSVSEIDGNFELEFEKYKVYYDNWRISLNIIKFIEGDMNDLRKGDFRYGVIEFYYPLAE